MQSPSPFGLVVSGRALQFVPQTAANMWGSVVQMANCARRAVVFLTGTPLPEGAVASVYHHRHYQGESVDPSKFTYVGQLTNDSPSLDFEVSFLPSSLEASNYDAFIGIQLEPESVASARMTQSQLYQPPTDTQRQALDIVGRKLYQDLAHFLYSHGATAYTVAQRTGPDTEVIPLSALQKWESMIQQRITNNRRFWSDDRNFS